MTHVVMAVGILRYFGNSLFPSFQGPYGYGLYSYGPYSHRSYGHGLFLSSNVNRVDMCGVLARVWTCLYIGVCADMRVDTRSRFYERRHIRPHTGLCTRV